MESIITEIGEKFIKNIVEIITKEEKSFSDKEKTIFEEVKRCAASLVGAYAVCLDAAIAEDKTGRKKAGYTVERRGDARHLQTLYGEVSYSRTYYKKASGGYEYLADRVLGVENRERVSESLSLSLVEAAKDMSYGKASLYMVNGEISRQTIMHRVRKSTPCVTIQTERRRVPELHIDADEAHVTRNDGLKSEVPLISIYEGIERNGKRNSCKNIFHISEYGMKTEDLWEHVLTEIEKRYDLSDTKIYLHGDGANWIQTGLEWIPGSIFVLDKYHKNKAIKQMTAGMEQKDRKRFDKDIREALADEDLRFFHEMTQVLCIQTPDRIEKIMKAATYLKRFVKGISICKIDPCANNGGCTEPHVSHILSARLSSRPMAWSKTTLEKLAPILASGKVTYRKNNMLEPLAKPLRKTAAKASKVFRRGTGGLPVPDAIGTLPLSGKVTGTQKILKLFQ